MMNGRMCRHTNEWILSRPFVFQAYAHKLPCFHFIYNADANYQIEIPIPAPKPLVWQPSVLPNLHGHSSAQLLENPADRL